MSDIQRYDELVAEAKGNLRGTINGNEFEIALVTDGSVYDLIEELLQWQEQAGRRLVMTGRNAYSVLENDRVIGEMTFVVWNAQSDTAEEDGT